MSASNIESLYEVDTADLLPRLGRFGLRSNLITAARFVLIGCVGWLGFVLLAMIVDYISEMSVGGRWFCSRGSAIAAVIAVSVFCYVIIRKTSTGHLACTTNYFQEYLRFNEDRAPTSNRRSNRV